MYEVMNGYVIKFADGTYDYPDTDRYRRFWRHKESAEFALNARKTMNPKDYSGATIVPVSLVDMSCGGEDR